MAIEVRPVRSRRDRRAFIELPFRLHASAEQWIPPLRIERRLFLSPRFNRWFRHAEAELFLALRDDRAVGRLSAQIDRNFNEYQGNDWGMFGFLEVEEDEEALRGLLDAAAAWLRARGCSRMVGPMDFTMNDECGVLIEGFDREPFIKQPWHPPYYQRLCEAADLEKAIDLWMWELHIEGRADVVPGIVEMARKLEPEHGIRIRKMSRRRLRRELDLFGETYNEAWKDNWGFVPYSKEDLDTYAQDLQLVFDKHWFMVAEKVDTGESVGVAITVPDINQVLKRMKGRILPFGWWHFLRRRRIVDRVRVGFLGVNPEYQHTGVAAGLYIEHFDMAEVRPQKWGEMGWILETNDAMNRGMEGMGGRIAKRYRVYERELSGRRIVVKAAGRAGGPYSRPGACAGRPDREYTRPLVPEPADSTDGAPEPVDGELVPTEGHEIAEVRHLPVPVDAPSAELSRPRPVSVPATVAAATGGFLLGVAAFMLIKVLRRPSAGRALIRRRSKLAAQRRGVDVQATRSFLVDVHLLKR